MGTIDKSLFERAGARGCGNSDYNLVKTTCCAAYLVEDQELGDLYTNAANALSVLGVMEISECPVCGATEWDFDPLNEWPKCRTDWQWAYHPDNNVVEQWLIENHR